MILAHMRMYVGLTCVVVCVEGGGGALFRTSTSSTIIFLADFFVNVTTLKFRLQVFWSVFS